MRDQEKDNLLFKWNFYQEPNGDWAAVMKVVAYITAKTVGTAELADLEKIIKEKRKIAYETLQRMLEKDDGR